MRATGPLPWLMFLVTVGATLPAQDNPPLHGAVTDGTYRSATGEFSVRVPVLPELGGVVTDTPEVVTFHDDFNVHASIACFEMDATQRWEEDTRGRREYLIWFFQQFVQHDFSQRFPGSRIESARYLPDYQEGALLVYNLLPGGSMFATEANFIGSPGSTPVAKRGNLLFVHNRHLYVLSAELAEKVLQPLTYTKTEAEENELLRERLFKLKDRMTFTAAPSP